MMSMKRRATPPLTVSGAERARLFEEQTTSLHLLQVTTVTYQNWFAT